jgi:hypothetical protein
MDNEDTDRRLMSTKFQRDVEKIYKVEMESWEQKRSRIGKQKKSRLRRSRNFVHHSGVQVVWRTKAGESSRFRFDSGNVQQGLKVTGYPV